MTPLLELSGKRKKISSNVGIEFDTNEAVKAKVCLITSRHEPWCFRIYYREARSLSRAGFDVQIILSTEKLCEKRNGVTVHGFNLNAVVPYKFGINKLANQLMFIYLGVKARADIYHCHSPEVLFSAYIIKLILRLFYNRKSAVIHEIRDFYLREALLDVDLGWREKIGLSLQTVWDKLLHRPIDFVIGVEESKLEKPLSYGLSPDKMAVVENYVPLDLFKERRKRFDKFNFVLGYAGGLSFLRGIDKLAIASVEFGKKVNMRPTLLLIGRFPRSLKDQETWLVDYCKENEKFVKLKYHKWLSHDRVAALLAKADICFALFYSKRYRKVLSTTAGPTKLYEYMALGKPTIATNVPALENIIQQTRCGLIIDEGAGERALADAIEFYYKNPDALRKVGKNARIAAEREYNWDIAQKKLLQIYNGIISKNGLN